MHGIVNLLVILEKCAQFHSRPCSSCNFGIFFQKFLVVLIIKCTPSRVIIPNKYTNVDTENNSLTTGKEVSLPTLN